MTQILIFNLLVGLVVVGGLWVASRETKPPIELAQSSQNAEILAAIKELECNIEIRLSRIENLVDASIAKGAITRDSLPKK